MSFENEKREETAMTMAAAVDAELKTVVNTTDVQALKKKYGTIYQIDVMVDEDDENEGRALRFLFRRPTTASFNRYLKTANKNMATSTANFVMDNIVDEQRDGLQKESDQYPGLALNIGTKLLSAIGMGDNVNFKKL